MKVEMVMKPSLSKDLLMAEYDKMQMCIRDRCRVCRGA